MNTAIEFYKKFLHIFLLFICLQRKFQLFDHYWSLLSGWRRLINAENYQNSALLHVQTHIRLIYAKAGPEAAFMRETEL